MIYETGMLLQKKKILLQNSFIFTGTVFSCKSIKSSEQFGRQYKYLDALLDE